MTGSAMPMPAEGMTENGTIPQNTIPTTTRMAKMMMPRCLAFIAPPL